MKPVLVLSGVVSCGLAVLFAGMPWTLRGAARLKEMAIGMSRDSGLVFRADGPVSIKLLPRPRVQIANVSVTARDGSIVLSAPSLSGELDIPALFRGVWRLGSITVSSPTAVLDIDVAGRAATAVGGAGSDAAPFRLSVRSGVFRLVSRRLGTDTMLTDIGVTADTTPGSGGGLSVSGNAIWHGLPAQFALKLGEPVGVADDRQAGAFLQISSPAGSFSAVGEVSDGAQPQFAGRLSASTTAPARLFSALGLGPFWVDAQKISLSGDALAKPGDLSLSEADLRLNANVFEGTLGYHTDKGRALVEGTLATDKFDLGQLTGRTIDQQAVGDLYRTELAPHFAETNLDLRLSAGELLVGGTTAKDVALSVLSRDRRVEVTLDEALVFGGVVKARVLASPRLADIETHAEMSLSAVELGPLDMALTGRERLSGTMSGKLSVDGHGARLGDIVRTLAGEGKVSVGDGNFMGLSVSQALKRFTRKLPFGADQPAGQLTAFAAASSDLRIQDGRVDFVGGKVSGPGIAMDFAGHGDLPQGKVDILAVASQTDASGLPMTGMPDLPLEMRGAWGEPLMLIERGRHLPLPLLLPDIATGQIIP